MVKLDEISVTVDGDYAEEVRLRNIVTMGLGFSAMTRLYESASKDEFHRRILGVVKELFQAKSREEYVQIHSTFCEKEIGRIKLAKKGTAASYGQIAKTLDVVMKVAVYYAQLPDCRKAQELTKWLNAAVDTRMMAYLNKYLNEKHPQKSKLPKTVEKVKKKEHTYIQDVVRDFIKEKHQNKIYPAQFDDIYWRWLNRKP